MRDRDGYRHPPMDSTPAERRALHKKKMADKKAARPKEARPTRNWYVVGNLSRKHKLRGRHPSQSYSG